MSMYDYGTIKEAILEVQQARKENREVYDEKDLDLIVDVIPFLKSLEEYDIVFRTLEFYNYDTDEYEEYEGTEYFEMLEKSGKLKEISHENSYNWFSPLSNDLDFIKYENVETDEIYIQMMVHLGGDPRGNYTDYILLRFTGEREFYEAFYEETYNGTEIGSKLICLENVSYKGKLYSIVIQSFWHDEVARYYITDENYDVIQEDRDYFGLEYKEIKQRAMEILSKVVA